jgi:3-methyladenine DNA glycosylase AlkD
MNISKKVVLELEKVRDDEKEKIFYRFFKTKKGEYGNGDIFWGITVPKIRYIAKRYYKDISFNDIKELISSSIHEIRLTGFIIHTYKYERGSKDEKKDIIDFYLNNLKGVNNWDIVDLSCYKILGNGIYEGIVGKEILYELARSKNMWERRVSIVSTYSLIRNDIYEDTLNISKILLEDSSDLIQKAIGWMLREVGKRDIQVLREFLDLNMKDMSRITLRYSIERMGEKERKEYLKSSLQ